MYQYIQLVNNYKRLNENTKDIVDEVSEEEKLLRTKLSVSIKMIHDLKNKKAMMINTNSMLNKNNKNISILLVVNWLLGFLMLCIWLLVYKNNSNEDYL